MKTVQQGFQGTEDPIAAGALFDWLKHADAQAPVQEIKRRMLELAAVHEGDRVLDNGCGIGLETARLARRVGPSGRVVGIDVSPPMIAEARRRAGADAAHIEYAVMDAQRLDFPDGAFDLCRTERVLRYVEQPAQALREMARVVRPGGHVVAFDFDSDATVIDAPDLVLVRRVREILDAAVPHSWIGRQLPRLFRQAGLVEVAVVPHVLMLPSLESYRRLVEGTLERAVCTGRLTADDLVRWWSSLKRAERDGGLVVANLGFIVSGCRPPAGGQPRGRAEADDTVEGNERWAGMWG